MPGQVTYLRHAITNTLLSCAATLVISGSELAILAAMPVQQGSQSTPATDSTVAESNSTEKKTEERPLTPTELKAIEFDPAQTTPIFSHGFQGSTTLANQADPPPRFELYADGKLIVRAANGGSELKTELTPAEVKSFLHFVVNEQKMFEYDAGKVQSEMTKVKPQTVVLDAPTSTFTIAVKQGKISIQQYSLFNADKNYPEIKSLANLLAIQKKCGVIAGKAYLGDDEQEVIAFVNRAIVELNRGLAPVTLDELRTAVRLPRGRFQVSFTRELAPRDDQSSVNKMNKTLNIIYFKKDEASKPEVKFYGLMKE